VAGAATLLFDIAPAINAQDWVSELAAASVVRLLPVCSRTTSSHILQPTAGAAPPTQPSFTSYLSPPTRSLTAAPLCCCHHQATRIQLACAAYKHAWHSRGDTSSQPISIQAGGLKLQDVLWMRAQWLLARTLCAALFQVQTGASFLAVLLLKRTSSPPPAADRSAALCYVRFKRPCISRPGRAVAAVVDSTGRALTPCVHVCLPACPHPPRAAALPLLCWRGTTTV
jgi:hypothetical protein